MADTNELMNTDATVTACRLLQGKVVHAAIKTTMKNPNSGVEFESFKPLCGKRAPRHSLTYGFAGTRETVNCGKCLARQAQQ